MLQLPQIYSTQVNIQPYSSSKGSGSMTCQAKQKPLTKAFTSSVLTLKVLTLQKLLQFSYTHLNHYDDSTFIFLVKRPFFQVPAASLYFQRAGKKKGPGQQLSFALWAVAECVRGQLLTQSLNLALQGLTSLFRPLRVNIL